MPNTGIPLSQWSGSESTENLREDLNKYQKDNDLKQNIIIVLTVVSIAIAIMGLLAQLAPYIFP